MSQDPTLQASTDIRHADTDAEIAETFDVMVQLRPHLVRDDYVTTVRSLMNSDGYRLLSLTDAGVVRAVAGYRFMHTLYCPRILCVDELVTDENTRSHGYGARLLDALKELARTNGYQEIHLISRLIRERAHQFYLRQGFSIECYHFSYRCD